MNIKFTVKENDLIQFKKRRYIRMLVNRAVSKGDLKKPDSCELCREKCNAQSHHVDYGKPFTVVWLCRKCHGMVHRKNHILNPSNNVQTPLPSCVDKYEMINISFTVPIRNYLALVSEAKKQKKTIASIIREHTLKIYPIDNNQLEFNFEENSNDYSSSFHEKRIPSVAENENVLLQQESTHVQEVRRKRNLNCSGMEQFFTIPIRHGSNSRALQRLRTHR